MNISKFDIKFDSVTSCWVVVGWVSENSNGFIAVADQNRDKAIVKFADAVLAHRDHCIV